MKTIILALTLLIASACYNPTWNRPNTTYAQLNEDSTFCKNSLNIGSSRYEKISTYEKCMKEKGYQLPDEKVYIRVRGGGTYYHRPSCPNIRTTGDLVTKELAENQGYSPCPVCKP